MPHAVVIGGSVGGLFAANLLQASGWRVSVVERTAQDLSDRGASVATTDELLRVLRRIDPRTDDSIGVETRSRICMDCRGKVVDEASVDGLLSAWSRIYRPLKAAFPIANYLTGTGLERVEQAPGEITAILADGQRLSADLLVAADGLHSTVRRQLLPGATPAYAGYVVWRIVLGERQIPPPIHAEIFARMTFCFLDREMVLCLPVAGAEPRGEHRFQIAWYRPADEAALADMCTDESGRRHGMSIPPPLIRRDLIESAKADAAATLAPQIAELVALAPQPILQPIFDCETPQMGFDRVALLGDAAFVARPHVGAGVTKAALDAECLTQALADHGNDVRSALADYDQKRQPAGRRLVARGRHLGAHLGTRIRDGAGPHPDRGWILREYGGARTIELGGDSGTDKVVAT